MSQRFYTRVMPEIAAVVALAQTGVMFLVPQILTGTNWLTEAVVGAALLTLLAGPVIAFRVRGWIDEQREHVLPDRAAARNRPMGAAVLALAGGLLITAVSARWVWSATERDAWQRFDLIAERVRSDAAQRMTLFTHGLRGCRGLFIGSENVLRGEFREYAKSRNLKIESAGALGIGFIERVPRAQLADWITATRADGCPEFTVDLNGETSTLYVTKFVEPADANHAELGFDNASDAARKEAADRAMRTGEPAATGVITLLPERTERKGLLFVLPVYQRGTNPQTERDRIEACIGWTYNPIVLEETLRSVTAEEDGMVDLEVFDGAIASAGNMIYDDDGVFSRATQEPSRFERNSPLTVGGRSWTLRVSSLPEFDRTARPVEAMAVAAGGFLVSVLLAGLVWVMSNSRVRAVGLATAMTAELKGAKEAAEQSLREQAASLQLTASLAGTEDVKDAAGAVMTSIAQVTGLDRCAVLLYPGKGGDGTCRFVGSMGLSEAYQKAVQGHCPWREGQADAEPIIVGDVGTEPSLEVFRELFKAEQVGTVAFIPVRTEEGVVGKLMLYHAAAGAINQRMVEGAVVLAGFLGMAVGRLRAEAKTRDSENLFRLLVEGGDEFVNLMTTDRKALYVSPSYFKLTGWTPEDLRAKDFVTRIHPDDVDRVLKARDENLAGKATRIEYRALKKDGSSVWLDLRATPVMDPTGTKVDRILCFSRDISEAKQVEQRIRESEQRLELAVRGSRDGMWDYEHATGVAWRSDRLLEMEGYARGEVPSTIESWQERMHPDDRERSITAFMRHAEADVPFDIEFRMKCKSGEYRWFRGRAESVRDAQGKAIRTSGSMSDIHERRQAEQRLEESERRMRAIIDGTDVIAWEFDVADDRYTYVSPQAEKMGYSINQWLEPGFWDRHVHPDDYDAALRLCLHESSHGRSHRNQYRMMRADGEYVWVDDFVSVEMRGDKPGTLRGVLIDMTEARRLRDMAEAANAAKSEFLANMSHEIRTPLTAILGYTELLVEDGNIALAPRGRVENLATIKRAGEHLLTVVNDILDLSKIEAGRLHVEEIECDLPGVLGEIGSLMGARAKEKGIGLEVKLGNAVPTCAKTDPTRLRQILINLVGNAVKFTEQGQVTVTASFEDSVLVVDVEDTGPGLSEAQAERLFVPFTQADTSVTRKHGGTGLGLTICRRLAALMGGNVCLHRTQLGRGSVFRLMMPVRIVKGAGWTRKLEIVTSGADGAEGATKLKGRILLAEDGADNQRLISFYLKRAGAEVDIAENGRIALQMIEEADGVGYDILLTDMQMPEVDGYTLAKALREQGSKIPIIALTAHAMAEDRRKCLEAGCDDYASKPIDKAALIATCAAWIGRDGGGTKRLAA